MNDARSNILGRLRANRPVDVPAPAPYAPAQFESTEHKVRRFSERMRAVRGEVQRLSRAQLPAWLQKTLPARGLHKVLLGTDPRADELAGMLAGYSTVRRYEEPVERWKDELFNAVDVAITGCRCAIAETGSLVLWPGPDEPRLMSLVPPVHIALLDTHTLYSSFAEVIAEQHWENGMPTNALLVSGPSKTADIEQTLAYGIHGPKELIVLLLD
jgi:L-lactate dehydrogenase complex protein LldG